MEHVNVSDITPDTWGWNNRSTCSTQMLHGWVWHSIFLFTLFIVVGICLHISLWQHTLSSHYGPETTVNTPREWQASMTIHLSTNIFLHIRSPPPPFTGCQFSCLSSVFPLTAWSCSGEAAGKGKGSTKIGELNLSGQLAAKWIMVDANGLNCKNMIFFLSQLTTIKPKPSLWRDSASTLN